MPDGQPWGHQGLSENRYGRMILFSCRRELSGWTLIYCDGQEENNIVGSAGNKRKPFHVLRRETWGVMWVVQRQQLQFNSISKLNPLEGICSLETILCFFWWSRVPAQVFALFCNHLRGHVKIQANANSGFKSSSREKKSSAYDAGEVF